MLLYIINIINYKAFVCYQEENFTQTWELQVFVNPVTKWFSFCNKLEKSNVGIACINNCWKHTMPGIVLLSTQIGGHGDGTLRSQERAHWTLHLALSPPQLWAAALQTVSQAPLQAQVGQDVQSCKFSGNKQSEAAGSISQWAAVLHDIGKATCRCRTGWVPSLSESPHVAPSIPLVKSAVGSLKFWIWPFCQFSKVKCSFNRLKWACRWCTHVDGDGYHPASSYKQFSYSLHFNACN